MPLIIHIIDCVKKRRELIFCVPLSAYSVYEPYRFSRVASMNNVFAEDLRLYVED